MYDVGDMNKYLLLNPAVSINQVNLHNPASKKLVLGDSISDISTYYLGKDTSHYIYLSHPGNTSADGVGLQLPEALRLPNNQIGPTAIIMFGTNDCEGIPPETFKRNMAKIANDLWLQKHVVPLLSTIPERIPCNLSPYTEYNQKIRELSVETGFPVRCMNQLTRDEMGLRFPEEGGDGVHPTNYARIDQITHNLENAVIGQLNLATLMQSSNQTNIPFTSGEMGYSDRARRSYQAKQLAVFSGSGASVRSDITQQKYRKKHL